MARGRLSPLEIAVLRRNPYVEDVNETRIIYTYKFKCMFMEQYLAGARPVDIFRQAGFDVSVLGEKRIERATARWKALYAGNGVEGLKGTARKNGTADLPPAGQKGHAGLAGKKGQRQRMGWQRDAGDGVEPIKGLCGLLLIPIYRYFAHAWHGLAKYWGLGFALWQAGWATGRP